MSLLATAQLWFSDRQRSLVRLNIVLLVNWLTLFYALFPVAVFLNPSKGGTSNFFYLGILLPWLALVCLGQLKHIPRSRLLFSSFVLFGFLWLNTLWSEHNSAGDILYFAKRLAFVACLLTAPLLITRHYPRFYLILLPLIFLAAVISAPIIVGLHIHSFGEQALQKRMWGIGYGYNPIALAINYGIALLISFYLMEHYPRWRWVIGLFSLLPLVAMLMTQSRGPILFFIIACDLYLLAHARRRDLFLFKLVLLLLVAVVCTSIGWDNLLQRGFSHRPEIWRQTLEWFSLNPWLGEGFSLQADRIQYGAESASHSHNFILEVMRYGGLCGLALCLWQLRDVFCHCLRELQSPYLIYAVILIFGLLCMLVNGWYLLDRPNYFWLTYWYPIGALLAAQHLSTTTSSTNS